jgi:hypothetical protein
MGAAMSSQGFTLEPFAVSPKTAMQIEQCGMTELYRRINSNEYESYHDGGKRLITLRSIHARRERLLAEAGGPPRKSPSKRRGGPGRPHKAAPRAASP